MSKLVQALSYSFLFPPMLFVLTALAGTFAALRWRRAGLATALASLVLLLGLATPVAADLLAGALERLIPADRPGDPAGAIVVLGADLQADAGAAGRVRLGLLSLERVTMAAQDYRSSGLPILVSGGTDTPAHPPLADLMAQALTDGFGIAPDWRETRSRNTYENARYSAEILGEHGISTVTLVAQRRDMPRAIWAFSRFAIAARPTRFAAHEIIARSRPGAYLPTIGALQRSFYALHELIGLFYYRLVYS